MWAGTAETVGGMGGRWVLEGDMSESADMPAEEAQAPTLSFSAAMCLAMSWTQVDCLSSTPAMLVDRSLE